MREVREGATGRAGEAGVVDDYRVGCDEPVNDRVRYDKGLEMSGGKSM